MHGDSTTKRGGSNDSRLACVVIAGHDHDAGVSSSASFAQIGKCNGYSWEVPSRLMVWGPQRPFSSSHGKVGTIVSFAMIGTRSARQNNRTG